MLRKRVDLERMLGAVGVTYDLPRQIDGQARPRVRVEVCLPSGAVLSGTSPDTTVQAWVFGKILNWSVEQGTVLLQIRPIAILRDYAHQH